MNAKICVFTGSRADYGHLRWLMQDIQDDPDLDLQLLVSGAHLVAEFGNTITAIEADGFVATETVDILQTDDRPVSVAKSMGLGLIGYAQALSRMTPDVLVILGDRYEALAAAEAAVILRVRIAHIHGGETTEGAWDDAFRHAITQMADWHFPAAPQYADRIRNMGIAPATIVTAGAPGLDQLARSDRLDRAQFEQETGLVLGRTTLLVTYHPATAADEDPVVSVNALIGALERMTDARIIVTGANADAGGRAIDNVWAQFVTANPDRVSVVPSLGIRLYHAALGLCDAVVGNSSSGLIEAPAIGVPTVNIGMRQGGRARAPSVIDCAPQTDAIFAAIGRALSADMKAIAARRETPYGAGGASRRIKDVLKRAITEVGAT